MCVCMYVCTCVCVYVCVYMCVRVHAHVYVCPPQASSIMLLQLYKSPTVSIVRSHGLELKRIVKTNLTM